MSLYHKLVQSPISINVKGKPQEVRFKLVSCMCDNRYSILFTKQENDSYRVSAGRFALSNFQMDGDYESDLKWMAAQGKWNEVAKIIRSGTSTIESVEFLEDYNESNEVDLLSEIERIEEKIKLAFFDKLKGKTRGIGVKKHCFFIGNNRLVNIKIKNNQLCFTDEFQNQHSIDNINLKVLVKLLDKI